MIISGKMIELISANSIRDRLFDVIIIIADGINSLNHLDAKCPEIRPIIENFSKV